MSDKDLTILAQELKEIAEGELPDTTVVPMEVMAWAEGWLLALAELGIQPREGWAHVGCPTCGQVNTVPLDRVEPPPWCIHNGSYVWRDPHPDTQIGPNRWTQMVRVRVSLA